MTSKINLNKAIETQATSLLQEVKSFVWEINPNSIEDCVVRASTQEFTVSSLESLLKTQETVDKTVLQTLVKVKAKIAIAKTVIGHFLTPSKKGLDPRIEKILSKLESQTKSFTREKINKYSHQLNQLMEHRLSKTEEDLSPETTKKVLIQEISKNFPEITEEELLREVQRVYPETTEEALIQNIQKELSVRRMGLLQSEPSCTLFDLTNETLIEEYYTLNAFMIGQKFNCNYINEDIKSINNMLTPQEIKFRNSILEENHTIISNFIVTEKINGEYRIQATQLSSEEILHRGKERSFILYFEALLDPEQKIQENSDLSEFGKNLIETAHLQIALDIQNGCISESQLLPPRSLDDKMAVSPQNDDRWSHQLVCYEEKDNNISLPRQITEDDILETFLLIDGSKQKSKLSSVGIFMKLNNGSNLAITIHNKNYINLFNPYGDKTTGRRPYLISFGNFKQLAKHIHNQISMTNIEGGDVTLLALCNRRELKKIVKCNRKEQERINASALSLEEILDSLQKALSALSSQNEEGLCQAIELLMVIPKGQKCFFSVSNGTRGILDEIYFQLLTFQDKETQETVQKKTGLNTWGSEAFPSDDISPDQKQRAVERVQIEILLSLFKQSLEPDLADDLPKILKQMEGLTINIDDLPKGKENNLAHLLFGNLYRIYIAAWGENQSMVHPHDGSFDGDFGRNAFTGDAKASVDNDYKLKALEEVIKSLKETWKI